MHDTPATPVSGRGYQSPAERMAARLGPGRPVTAVLAPRWRAERALRAAKISAGAMSLGQAIILAMDADGAMPERVTRAELCRRAKITPRSFSRSFAQLEEAGIFTRWTVMVQVAPMDYRRRLAVGLGPAFALARATKTTGRTENGPDLRKGHGVPPTPYKSETVGHHGFRSVGYVQAVTPGRARIDALGAQPADMVADDQRHADRALAAEHWPRLALARSDLPDARPSAVRFTAPPCGHCQTRHSRADLCPDDPRAIALAASEGRY